MAGEPSAERDALLTLLPLARPRGDEARQTDDLARRLVHAARAARRERGGLDAFLSEYGLSTEEGVILMCLAEALLRIPDAATADDFIDDKIKAGDWARHLGQSDSLFVNASSWGLLLTGKVIGLKDAKGLMGRFVARSGEPVIRGAMRQAMRIMGDHFVLGRTIEEALSRARTLEAEGYRHSYDMLGEAARTMDDADRYAERYLKAIAAIAKGADPKDSSLMARPGLSIKLSALHPRFEAGKAARLKTELGGRIADLLDAARKADIPVTIDAEEADRLSLSLDLIEDAMAAPKLKGWDGVGLAVQAYGLRALPTLKRLQAAAARLGRRLPVRLVKGAYWDSEVKWAQERGLDAYPVFTRKCNTDASYLGCARFMLSEPKAFFPQFATHNAQTLAAILSMAGEADFEFQRLHGMGEALYREVTPRDKLGKPCRIYAPVGEHEDLLAYLVRRLLENGANTSFVNRLSDDELPIAEIIKDPVAEAEAEGLSPHPRIPLPKALYAPARVNSAGLRLWETPEREALIATMHKGLDGAMAIGPIFDGKAATDGPARELTSPQNRKDVLGRAADASPAQVQAAIASARAAQPHWDRMGGAKRAEILERAATLFEARRPQLMAALVREGGKTLTNALGEVREATDFLRYYAAEARRLFSDPVALPGPTGERNQLWLKGRGVFACISPWNFPLAIFTGQVAAGLAAGNAVIAKPAEQTPLTGFLAIKLLHEAGVPGAALHFLPGDGATVGGALTADPRVTGFAFTGSTETARLIQATLASRPGPIAPLIAETGGLNAMIVDSSALPEQVVRDAVASAFDSAGQRCSALRVLFLQDEIASKTLKMLTGAIRELTIGDPMDYATDVGPVIDLDAKASLEAHKARMRREAKEVLDLPLPPSAEAGTFVSPAVYEIDAISRLEREVFGPILHVVRYARAALPKVCEAINATGYGLTCGVHTRLESTADFVAASIHAGNIYVNRNQIGAVVGVQPFGGEGLSGTGPKAGGPHYLPRFAVERVVSTDVTASGGNASLFAAMGAAD